MKGNNVKTLTMLGPLFCVLRHIQVMHFDQKATGQADNSSFMSIKRGGGTQACAHS